MRHGQFKILGRVKVRGKTLYAARAAVEVHLANVRICRASDGAFWPVQAIERYDKRAPKGRLRANEAFGAYLPDDCDLAEGDVVELLTPEQVEARSRAASREEAKA